ncbi:MAG: GDP-mannose 4,6-dehydratase [Candidatus Levybacteria bacterium]|nr:GDP-mannose 4,6-dehydratase [Candidatus Levybacteria bacterium]
MTMTKVLITGVTGFAGSYLAKHLLLTGKFDISGTYLLEESLKNIQEIKDKLNLIKIDLSRTKNVFDMIKNTSPAIIFHLAALTSPFDSFNNPIQTLNNNISLQVNLLESVRKNNLFKTKILIVSSADIYGLVKEKYLPIDEETPLMPTSPYSVSKIAQDFLGLSYFLAYRLKIVRVRPFNHIGPKQSPHFVVSSFAKQISEIEKGKKEPILRVGNLEAKRDFTDVRDMVNAYVLATQKGKDGEVYNLGSGRAYKISEILEKLVSLSFSKIKVVEDKTLFRPNDNPQLVCNADKFTKLTGWRPQIPLATTLKETLDYWRKMI